METLTSPAPQIKDGKMARFCPLRGFILDLGGDGGLLFHFILSKIVVIFQQAAYTGVIFIHDDSFDSFRVYAMLFYCTYLLKI